MLPPAMLRILVVEDGRKKFRFWAPIFLLWPGLVVLAVVSIPLVLVLLLISLWSSNVRAVLRSTMLACRAVCALRGLKIEVDDDKDKILISVT